MSKGSEAQTVYTPYSHPEIVLSLRIKSKKSITGYIAKSNLSPHQI